MCGRARRKTHTTGDKATSSSAKATATLLHSRPCASQYPIRVQRVGIESHRSVGLHSIPVGCRRRRRSSSTALNVMSALCLQDASRTQQLLVVGARRGVSGNSHAATPEHRTIQRLESMMMMEEGGISTPRLHRRNIEVLITRAVGDLGARCLGGRGCHWLDGHRRGCR